MIQEFSECLNAISEMFIYMATASVIPNLLTFYEVQSVRDPPHVKNKFEHVQIRDDSMSDHKARLLLFNALLPHSITIRSALTCIPILTK